MHLLRLRRFRNTLAFAALCGSCITAQTPHWEELSARGDEALAKGRYVEANKYLDAALSELQTASQPDVRWAPVLNSLGAARHFVGDFEAAQTFFRQALGLWERIGDAKQSVATVLFNLGQSQYSTGDYVGAELSLKHSLAIAESLYPNGGPSVGSTLDWLGIVYTGEQKYTEAEQMLSRAMAILRHASSASRIDLAHCMNSVAELRAAQNALESAEPLLEEALRIYQQELGDDHPTTAISLAKLGGFYLKGHRRELAEPLLRRALRTEERTLGPEHPRVASTLIDLALLYTEDKKFALAEPLWIRALSIEEKTKGANHPSLARILNQLSLGYIEERRYARAEPLLTRAVAVSAGDAAFAGEQATGLRWLGLVYDHEGKSAAAESAYKEALDILSSSAGSENANLLPLLRDYLLVVRKNRDQELHELEGRIKALRSGKSRQ